MNFNLDFKLTLNLVSSEESVNIILNIIYQVKMLT